MLVGHNDMINVACDEVFTAAANVIMEYYSTLEERLEVIDHTFDNELDCVLGQIRQEVMMAKPNIIHSIKWHLADIHQDQRLIDELIEEQNSENERNMNEWLKTLE